MSGSFSACSYFVFIAAFTAATKLPTALTSAVFPPDGGSSIDDGERQKTSSPFAEVVHSSMFDSDPLAAAAAYGGEEDVFKLSPLAGDVERRRSNFRGDLGKRSQRGGGNAWQRAELPTARRGMRTANSRLRLDLGKRSSVLDGGAAAGGRLLIDSRTAGLRRRFRPDLGKRAADATGDETFLQWPSYLGFGADEDGLMTPEADLRNDYARWQAAEGPESDQAKRGRQSTFRGDLGKRRLPSSFRGDLGRRRRRSTEAGEQTGWPSSSLSRLLDSDGSIDEENVESMAKRFRPNAKNAFRGDLGKRRSAFRGDLGKRDSTVADDDAVGSNEGAVGGPLSSSEEIEKRPRMSSLRGDLGKRDTPVYGVIGEATDAVGGDAKMQSASSFVKRPRPQSFRGDLGKRSAVESTDSGVNESRGVSAVATTHE